MDADHEGVVHEYDGIIEHDNRLPNWWLFTLYGAILFAFGYWLYFHTFGIGMSAQEALAFEIREADALAAQREEARLATEGALTDESLLALVSNGEAVARGKETFGQSCLACHGMNGEGTVGPNLTDRYWIHGSKPTDIHAVVSDGRLAQGMPAWKPVLGASRVRDVTAFLLSLKNTNVPGKAPQGVDDSGAAPATPGT